jgi:hypothetical protein
MGIRSRDRGIGNNKLQVTNNSYKVMRLIQMTVSLPLESFVYRSSYQQFTIGDCGNLLLISTEITDS